MELMYLVRAWDIFETAYAGARTPTGLWASGRCTTALGYVQHVLPFVLQPGPHGSRRILEISRRLGVLRGYLLANEIDQALQITINNLEEKQRDFLQQTGGGAAASPCISRTPTAAYINPFESSCQGGTSFPFHGGRRRREVDHLEFSTSTPEAPMAEAPWAMAAHQQVRRRPRREAMALLPSIFTGVADCIYACTSNGVVPM